MKPEYWVSKFSMQEHPEGGHFKQTFRSERLFDLPGYSGPRSAITVIYYLLKSGQFSAFHRIKSDEVWHYYAGSPLLLHIISDEGKLRMVMLGKNPDRHQNFQAAIEAGSWFAATVASPRSYSLVGCTVAPGFEFEDWELGDRESLVRQYPRHKRIIEKFTR
jgi:hypothetical protein